MTNAVAESVNSKNQTIKHAARGFRSFAAYLIRIFFHCGRLNLRPCLSHG